MKKTFALNTENPREVNMDLPTGYTPLKEVCSIKHGEILESVTWRQI